MLSGSAIECVSDATVMDVRERDWMELHREIKSVWKQRTALEAREVALLLDAEETGLFPRLGYATIYAYIEAELGYSHHVATERMRVGHELVMLPGIAEEFHAGELPWSSVRELTRVVTPATESAWLDAVEGKRADEVQRMVRGKSKGDLPSDPVDASKIRNRIVLDDITEEGLMMWKQARLEVARGCSRARARTTRWCAHWRSRSSNPELRPTGRRTAVHASSHHVPHVQAKRAGRRGDGCSDQQG